MPTEKWEDSNDKALLLVALKDKSKQSARFKTAEEVNKLRPFNRWPKYRFRNYFKNALLFVLKQEAIADQDNADFLALAQANPRPDQTDRGMLPFQSSSPVFNN